MYHQILWSSAVLHRRMIIHSLYFMRSGTASQWRSACSSCIRPWSNDWLIEQGLTSHKSHYRSYRDGFYGSNDPTNSVEALKEVVILRIGFNPTSSTSPCYNPVHAYNNTYTKINLSTVKWAQWDKTQSRELLGLFICVCIALCTIVVHNIAQNRPDNFPSYPPDNHHCSDDVYLREGGYTLKRLWCITNVFTYWHILEHTDHQNQLNPDADILTFGGLPPKSNPLLEQSTWYMHGSACLSSPLQEENFSKVVSATSHECFLVLSIMTKSKCHENPWRVILLTKIRQWTQFYHVTALQK